MKSIIKIIVFETILLLSINVYSTTDTSTPPQNTNLLKNTAFTDADVKKTENKLRIERLESEIKKLHLEDKETEMLIASNNNIYQIRGDTFKNQQKQNIMIFYLVLFLVVSSISFVFIQLFIWAKEYKKQNDMINQMRNSPNNNPTQTENDQNDTTNQIENSQFELSPQSLKVTTPFIGLLTLIVTYLFFYMYITEVYKITEMS
ncbi:hypothetical protein [Acinetobacter sp. BHS4]|uniref:hypothetical protein n=1 Tax=Acinetobacter sp. BHS4 TaxID=2836181 RepID=UPI001BCD2034|nr:hypothetical protein [Acinetobacter sp. BHS4]QVR68804.1 hypothetical protein KIP84_04360 [Acinetobacter sp. BHS4]